MAFCAEKHLNDIKDHVFNDPELDSITDFDYAAREALIKHVISKKEYLIIENVRNAVITGLYNSYLSNEASQVLRECLAGY